METEDMDNATLLVYAVKVIESVALDEDDDGRSKPGYLIGPAPALYDIVRTMSRRFRDKLDENERAQIEVILDELVKAETK